MKIVKKCNYTPCKGEVLSQEKHEDLDDLKPLTLAQQFSRLTLAGEKLEATRRKELTAINGRLAIDDPDSVATELDGAEDLHDIADFSVKYRAKKMQKAKEQKAEKGVSEAEKKDETPPKENETK